MSRWQASTDGNDIRIIVTGLLVAEALLWGFPDHMTGSRLAVASLHHFFHANIFHLAANLLSVWVIFAKGTRYRLSSFVKAYVIATAAWFVSGVPSIGMSNMIFALIGLRTPPLDHQWWRQSSVKVFLAVTVVMAFVPNVSALTHVVSFVSGCIMAALSRTFNRISSDYSRASYH